MKTKDLGVVPIHWEETDSEQGFKLCHNFMWWLDGCRHINREQREDKMGGGPGKASGGGQQEYLEHWYPHREDVNEPQEGRIYICLALQGIQSLVYSRPSLNVFGGALYPKVVHYIYKVLLQFNKCFLLQFFY